MCVCVCVCVFGVRENHKNHKKVGNDLHPAQLTSIDHMEICSIVANPPNPPGQSQKWPNSPVRHGIVECLLSVPQMAE